MGIRFHCRCGRTLEVGGELGGKKVRCPGCRTVLVAPRKIDLSFSHGDSEQIHSPAERQDEHQHVREEYTETSYGCSHCGSSREEIRKEVNEWEERGSRGKRRKEETSSKDPGSLLIFLIGILGTIFWFLAPVFGPTAWILGNKHRRRVRRGRYQRSTLAIVGWILGIVETVISLAILGLVFLVLTSV